MFATFGEQVRPWQELHTGFRSLVSLTLPHGVHVTSRLDLTCDRKSCTEKCRGSPSNLPDIFLMKIDPVCQHYGNTYCRESRTTSLPRPITSRKIAVEEFHHTNIPNFRNNFPRFNTRDDVGAFSSINVLSLSDA